MKKTPNYIKKTLDSARSELLKNKQLQLTRDLYVKKLKEIFNEQVIELKDGIETKMSSTGSGKSTVINNTQEYNEKISINKTPVQPNNKIIFLSNEIIEQNLTDVEEANNELANYDEKIIDLKNEISDEKNEKIIQLIEEVDDIINLSDEVVDEVVKKSTHKDEIVLDNELNENLDLKSQALSNEQLETLNAKITDLDLNSNELTEKLDELLNQKNLFSDKFNDELDVKLTEALNRSEDNLESKINDINQSYQQEFSKYEDEANKNFANLEDQIGQLNNQYENIQNNINSISLKIEESINKIQEPNQNPEIEAKFEEKINDLKDNNLKIENTLNNLNNKIDETLDKISNFKDEVNKKVQDIEPELINKIEEKQRNKTESEKLQDKFDQMSKIMDMQNMRMLQMYHSSELQYSHSILKDNLNNSKKGKSKNIDSEMIGDEFRKEIFPTIQKEMENQFNLLKNQLSEYEIKSVLDKIKTTDLNKEFKRPTKKFSNLFDAKKYVKNSISKKSRDWIKDNDTAIDEIAKKLLDK